MIKMIENRSHGKRMVFRSANIIFREWNIRYYPIIVSNRMSQKNFHQYFIIIRYHINIQSISLQCFVQQIGR